MAHKHDNTINIPGYKSNVDYNNNFGLPRVSQYNFPDFSGKEISFYNESDKYFNNNSEFLVAVWKPKQFK